MFATISDDRIFETVTNTLRQGGALATNISRQDAARGLEAVSRSVRALDQHQDATGHSETWKCEEGGKTFGSARALDQHQDATGHSDGSDSYSEWECEECGRTFGSERSLDQHQDSTGHW